MFHSIISLRIDPYQLKVKGCVVPFGIKQNTELNSSKVNGYSLSIGLDSKYSKKVAELDSHLISVIYENRTKTCILSIKFH